MGHWGTCPPRNRWAAKFLLWVWMSQADSVSDVHFQLTPAVAVVGNEYIIAVIYFWRCIKSMTHLSASLWVWVSRSQSVYSTYRWYVYNDLHGLARWCLSHNSFNQILFLSLTALQSAIHGRLVVSLLLDWVKLQQTSFFHLSKIRSRCYELIIISNYQ